MTITKEGALASFYTVNKAPIKHLRVYFSPKQAGEGDPSPENVREITGWNGEKTCIYGKNLLPDDISYYHRYNNAQLPDDFVLGKGVFSGTVLQGARDVAPIICNYTYQPGTYTISFDFESPTYEEVSMWRPINFNSAKTADGGWPGDYAGMTFLVNSTQKSGHYSKTFTLNYEFKFSLNLHSFGNNSVTGVYKLSNLQLEKSSTATEYEPYRGHTYNLDWTNDIGTIYGGYVDLVTGELYKIWENINIGTAVVSIDLNLEGVDRYYISTPNAKKVDNSLSGYILCDCFTPAPILSSNANHSINVMCTINTSPQRVYFYTPNGTFSGQNSFKNYMTDKTFLYELASPQLISTLTPTQLQTLIGRNNIWSNADRVEVEYDLAESNDELYRRRNILLRSAPHIETASGSIAHFETDIAAPIKSAKISFSPIQEGSGDPSPENVRAISGWNSITIGNQSFSPGPYTAYTSNNGTYCNIKTGQTFKFEGTSEGLVLLNIYRQDESGIGSLRPMKNTNGVQWDIHTAAEDIARFIFVNSSVTNGYVYMLNNTNEIDWSTAAETIYGGYVDLINGKLVETHKILTLNGNESRWRTLGTNGSDKRFDLIITDLGVSTMPISNMFTYKGGQQVFGYYNLYYTQSLVITDKDGLFETFQDFKSWLAENTPSFIYTLATPIEYSLTPTQLKTLLGQNNIWTTANGPVDIQYYTH